eukprot:7065274-Prymnesium_polylepis.1
MALSACSVATSPSTRRKLSANRPCSRLLARPVRFLVLWTPLALLSTLLLRLSASDTRFACHVRRPQ